MLESFTRATTSVENLIAKSWYDAKKILTYFILDYIKIDACINDCCLYRGALKNVCKCPNLQCGAPSWKPKKDSKQKNVPFKRIRYFPLIPQL